METIATATLSDVMAIRCSPTHSINGEKQKAQAIVKTTKITVPSKAARWKSKRVRRRIVAIVSKSGDVRNGWKAGIVKLIGNEQCSPMITRSFILSLALVSLSACAVETYSPDKMCGGRLPNWQAPSAGIGELAILQPVMITKENRIRWNGKEISKSTLDHYLRLSKELDPRPQMVLRVHAGADCNQVVEIRKKMDSILGCRETGACGEGTGWRRWPGAKPEA